MFESEKRRHKTLAFVTLAFLLTATMLACTSPLNLTSASVTNSRTADLVPSVTHTVRVAIYDYDMANTTKPSYVSGPALFHNNASQLAAMLQSHGVSTTLLSIKDISSHKLKTADYDVLAIVDNDPRENITNMVAEFWLGGGGLLIFDSGVEYLCYSGILPPESLGVNGLNVYWKYSANDINVTTRHPVSQHYNVNNIISTGSGYARWNWTALQGSSIHSALIRVARSQDNVNTASVLAFDPTNRGGKVVTFAYDYAYEALPSLHQMIVDAANWLCPHPKARIAYDLSHQPDYGVDAWDSLAVTPQEHSEWRNALVNRSYTFDKLYPSASENLTASNLAPYDLIIIVLPHLNFTSSEVSAVTTWISNGGSAIIFGERPGLPITYYDENVNYLLTNFNLRVNLTSSAYTGAFSYKVEHPTVESCTQLSCLATGFVNYTSPAFPIWGTNAQNIIIAAQQYGRGRVILIPDTSMFRNNRINLVSHHQYAINVVNWLTASKANVLLYVDEPYSSNYYRTPVCQALNDLGIPFALTFTRSYLNLSMHLYSWTLVIIDCPWYDFGAYLSDISDYVDTGGRLIFSYYYVSLSLVIHCGLSLASPMRQTCLVQLLYTFGIQVMLYSRLRMLMLRVTSHR